MRITFMGGAGTVTGSKYLVQAGHRRILVDCGLFQGVRQWRRLNWESLPIRPRDIDAVVLTHAHLDHCGYLPVLVRDGFRGPVFCTGATRDLCGVVLRDSGRLQEEDAARANRHHYSRHDPARPLYTEADAELALQSLVEVSFDAPVEVADGVTATFRRAGHILGAAMIELEMEGSRVLFSGDLGRPVDRLIGAPARPGAADYLVVESTYGNRLHAEADTMDQLARVISRTAGRGGAVVIPAFAVARTQALILDIVQLRRAGRIPHIPIFLDSPMARAATDVFLQHESELAVLPGTFRDAFSEISVTETVQQSKRLDQMHIPRVIISASGMATGGRVLHHLKALGPDPRNTILLVGYQVPGTRGADLRAGVPEIKIHGAYVRIGAEVVTLEGLSAHADYDEILGWLSGFTSAPRRVFITHGEADAADALRRRIQDRFGWRCLIPQHMEQATLTGAPHVSAQAERV